MTDDVETTDDTVVQKVAPTLTTRKTSNHQKNVFVDSPPSFEAALDGLVEVKVIRSANRVKSISFALYFVTTLDAVSEAAGSLAKAQGLRIKAAVVGSEHQSTANPGHRTPDS